jgi:hypothetical protein
MNPINQTGPPVKSEAFWPELYSIFLFYLKIFLISLIFGLIFFFLYAGIKTNHIPLNVVASSLSATVSGIIVGIVFYYVEKRRSEKKQTLGQVNLVKETIEKERLKLKKAEFELEQLDLQLKQRLGAGMEVTSQQVKVVSNNDFERRMAGLFVKLIEPTPIVIMMVVLEMVKSMLGFSSVIRSETKTVKK